MARKRGVAQTPDYYVRIDARRAEIRRLLRAAIPSLEAAVALEASANLGAATASNVESSLRYAQDAERTLRMGRRWKGAFVARGGAK